MGKQDRLEEFIEKNRIGFDDAYASLKVWADIEKQLNEQDKIGKKKGSLRNYLFIGLILLVLVAVGKFIMTSSPARSEQKEMLFAELDGMEHYYNLQAGKMINTVSNDSDILRNQGLIEVENNISEIKAELENMPHSSEELALKALWESYQAKLLIIERIIEHYELSKSENEKNDENRQNI